MRRVNRLFVPLAALALALGCGESWNPTHPSRTVIGSGVLASESWPVSGFTAVSVSGAGHLVIERTGYESLQVTAEDNILPLLRAEVVGGRLTLGARPHTDMRPSVQVLYRLTVRDLVDIEGSGASWVQAYGLDTDALRLAFSGASIVEIGGVVRRQHAEFSGASRLLADGLQSREAVVSVSGASYARVRVTDWLSASASGVSTIEYVGDPLLSVSVSGSSVVRRVGG